MTGTDDPAIRSLQNRVSHMETRMEQYEHAIIALSHLVASLAEEHETVETDLPDTERPDMETESLAAFVEEESSGRQAAGSSDESDSMDDSF
ncbi:hypothetical protein [Halobacterium rubrum]|uniref:hypothetical protein n=1 Tax=Halobacterium TaxID=2239 RepID=UPI001F1C76E4|nr:MULTISPECIES: hypothetical protein [Halobacterium]MDH5021701.1 hypothetical protein [Halobacterium rubrum]